MISCMFKFHFRHIHLRHSNADGMTQVKSERMETHFDSSCACKCTCHWDLHIRLSRNTVLLGSYTTLGRGAGEFSKCSWHILLQGFYRHAFVWREVILCVLSNCICLIHCFCSARVCGSHSKTHSVFFRKMKAASALAAARYVSAKLSSCGVTTGHGHPFDHQDFAR